MKTQHKGWIALDIDGTITDHLHHIPLPVCLYLKNLFHQGWQIVFITGRPFSFGMRALSVFDFPFFLAVQNGADILNMPDRTVLIRSYLSVQVVEMMNQIYSHRKEDFIVYAGWELGDFCYYRPQRFSIKMLEHLDRVQILSQTPWQAVEDFVFDPDETFPLLKCLGTEELMQDVAALLKSVTGIESTVIRDPLDQEVFLNLITHAQATKGEALQQVMRVNEKQGFVIAAGDDRNDVSMLQCADIAIVMETAPLEMHSLADILAKPASKLGIIAALQKAVACGS